MSPPFGVMFSGTVSGRFLNVWSCLMWRPVCRGFCSRGVSGRLSLGGCGLPFDVKVSARGGRERRCLGRC